MNFVRRMAAPALAVALCSVGSACKTDAPAGTANPPEGGNEVKPEEGSDTEAVTPPNDGGGNEAEAPKTPPCEAKVADAPTALFGERILIRPPINVDLQEQNPMFAAAIVSGGFVSACDATVDRMSVALYENDDSKSIDAYLGEVVDDQLPAQGYKNGSRGDDIVSTKTEVHTTIEYPAANGQPPAALYIAVSRKFDNVFVVTFQTRPEEFEALQPSFKASAESLLVVPPDA